MATPSRRGRPLAWTEERIERELRVLGDELGHFPTARELESHRGDLLGAIQRNGGLRAWAERMGHQPRRAHGQRYWTDERIHEALTTFLCGDMGTFPTRREFEAAGLGNLWHNLRDRGELGRWAREFGLKERRQGGQPKDG